MMRVCQHVVRAFFAFLCLVAAGAGHTPAMADPLTGGMFAEGQCLRPVRVGYLPGRPPYQMVSDAGVVSGFDIDAARSLITGLGCQVEFVAVGWPRGLPLLERGMIDMLPGASFTEDRAAFALFSDPYRREEFALYVRAGQVASFPLTSLHDVVPQRFHLAMNSDAVYGADVDALLATPDFRSQVTLIKGVEQPALVSIGRVDGYLLDTGTAVAYNASVVRADRLERHPAVTIDNGPVHFMFSRLTVPEAFVALFNQQISLRSDDAVLMQ